MSAGLGSGVSGRLSVIVPAYNYGHFLGACLRSVLKQGIPDLELLVIDDGSEDNTAAVVAGFPTVRYRHQHNQGLSAARNSGLVQSSGETLLFLDADDLLAPASLAPRLAFLRAQSTSGWSVCGTRQFSATKADGTPQLGARWLLPPTDLGLRLMHFNIAPPHAYLMHRSVADAAGLFDTQLRACEDYDYWLRVLAQGQEPLYSPAGCVYYRKHATSMSANNSNQLHHDVLLHERLFDALLRGHQLCPSDPACALLAACAGVFTTLARLPTVDNADYHRLLGLMENCMTDWPTALAAALTPRRVLRDYYLLILLHKAALSSAREPRARAAFETLWEALQRSKIVVGNPHSRRLIVILGDLLLDRQAPLVDRYRVARLLLS